MHGVKIRHQIPFNQTEFCTVYINKTTLEWQIVLSRDIANFIAVHRVLRNLSMTFRNGGSNLKLTSTCMTYAQRYIRLTVLAYIYYLPTQKSRIVTFAIFHASFQLLPRNTPKCPFSRPKKKRHQIFMTKLPRTLHRHPIPLRVAMKANKPIKIQLLRKILHLRGQ